MGWQQPFRLSLLIIHASILSACMNFSPETGSIDTGSLGPSTTSIAPTIALQPQSISVPEGETATFTVTAAGGGLMYQWLKGGVPLSGETTSVLKLSTVTMADNGLYTVIVTNTLGTVISQPAMLQVTPGPFTVKVHTPAAFTASAPLKVGNAAYIDSADTAVGIPHILSQARVIKTNNADVILTSDEYLSFTVTRPATVYIAYDSLAQQLPLWMQGFVSSGYKLTLTSNTPTSRAMNLYSKVYPAGTIKLGANGATGAIGTNSNYIVFIEEIRTPELTVNPAARLLYNTTGARTGLTDLHNKTVAGNISVTVDSNRAISTVKFYLDDPLKQRLPFITEYSAPFDLFGELPDKSIRPFNTTSIANGPHSLLAEVQYSDGTIELMEAKFAVQNGTVVDKLQLCAAADLSFPVDLGSLALAGNAYINVVTNGTITKADFFVNDRLMLYTPALTDTMAPFTFSMPFNTTTLRNGWHELGVRLTMAGGGTRTFSRYFLVEN